MSWDKIITEPCVVQLGTSDDCLDKIPPVVVDPRCEDPVFRAANPGLCNDIDPRCEDPAFRAAHPELCDGITTLILKPGLVTLCKPRGVQFKTFVYANGTEMEVTTGLAYGSSDLYVVQIGAVSGKASAVGSGTATISVTWQNLTAFAQITVVDEETCCDGTKIGMLVLLDNSASMKRAFGFPYGNRINYAKILAKNFLGTINATKDEGALMTFNESGTLVQELTNDIATLQNQASAVTTTDLGTDLADGLKDAVDYINTDNSLTTKVIILITDGDDHGGGGARAIADNFVASGGVLIGVGVRAFGAGYDTLNMMSSGGYFLNAIDSNADDIFPMLSGLKGYFCAGNCVPPGDIIVPQAQLDYFGFSKWDVTSGKVDLIGGEPPYDLFDLIPGHGLYVDMVGSSVPLLGTIATKNPITFTAGTTYRLKFKMAGNQRVNNGPYTVKALIKDVNSADTFVSEDITISEYQKDFTDYQFDFLADANIGAKISFQQVFTPTMNKPIAAPVGLLLDDVQLIREPNGANETIFFDNFNEENALYIPPDCGPGTVVQAGGGYGTGYDCYGEGCLTTPPGAQQPDPTPQSDTLESDLNDGGGGGGGGGEGGTVNSCDCPSKLYIDTRDQEVLAEALSGMSSGTQGPQGFQGNRGFQGFQGGAGSQGNQGAQGSGTGGSGGVVFFLSDPEGSIVAGVGQLGWDLTGQSLYLKESGAGNTGWKLLLSTGYDPYVGAIGSGGSGVTIGTGNPEGAETGSPGLLFWDTTGQAFHLKESGTGNTGWKQLIAI